MSLEFPLVVWLDMRSIKHQWFRFHIILNRLWWVNVHCGIKPLSEIFVGVPSYEWYFLLMRLPVSSRCPRLLLRKTSITNKASWKDLPRTCVVVHSTDHTPAGGSTTLELNSPKMKTVFALSTRREVGTLYVTRTSDRRGPSRLVSSDFDK